MALSLPERRFVAGFFERLLCILSIHIPSIRIPSMLIHSIRIPPMRIHAQGIHQQEWQASSHTYPFNTYPTNTYAFNTYLFNTYPFNTYPSNAYTCTRYTSAGMAMYVSAKRILAYHYISRNGNEYQNIPLLLGGGGNKDKQLCFSFNFFATLLIEYKLYRARMNMEFITSYWPACLLACCLPVRLLLIFFYFSKNASTIAQNCSET